MPIDTSTSLEELAALVSTALTNAGIVATLSGGAAVSIYSDNAYKSSDLDFVSSERNKDLAVVIAELGFTQSKGSRLFEHPDCEWLLEFPPGPLGFGNKVIDAEDLPLLNTEYGQIRIITPTLSIIDRLAAYWYHTDPQTWDQALEVAKRQEIDWEYVYVWAENEGQDTTQIDKLKRLASAEPQPK